MKVEKQQMLTSGLHTLMKCACTHIHNNVHTSPPQFIILQTCLLILPVWNTPLMTAKMPQLHLNSLTLCGIAVQNQLFLQISRLRVEGANGDAGWLERRAAAPVTLLREHAVPATIRGSGHWPRNSTEMGRCSVLYLQWLFLT